MGTAEDKLEILDVIARSYSAADGVDPEALASVFTEDGTIAFRNSDRVIRGREGLIAFQKSLIAQRSEWQSRHLPGSFRFEELTSDSARLRYYIIVLRNEPGQQVAVAMVGTYKDELVRTPKGWRLKAREIGPDPR